MRGFQTAPSAYRHRLYLERQLTGVLAGCLLCQHLEHLIQLQCLDMFILFHMIPFLYRGNQKLRRPDMVSLGIILCKKNKRDVASTAIPQKAWLKRHRTENKPLPSILCIFNSRSNLSNKYKKFFYFSKFSSFISKQWPCTAQNTISLFKNTLEKSDDKTVGWQTVGPTGIANNILRDKPNASFLLLAGKKQTILRNPHKWYGAGLSSRLDS